MIFKRKGDKAEYGFLDSRCIGRMCWAPGHYQHRAPMAGGGSRNTGSPDTPCCRNRAYRGCPAGPEGERKGVDDDGTEYTVQGLPEYRPALAKIRRQSGWRMA